MDEPTGVKALRFEVGAGIILSLGQDLITDSIQALMELVKNAYDADSPWVSVEVNTTAVAREPQFRGARGFVRVVDRGHGMTLADIRNGWLTIAQSSKRQMKAEGRRTIGKNRTPLGDKGLGRLGSQALGRHVQIETRPEGTSENLTVWIDWLAFGEDTVLSAVEIPHSASARKPGESHGTTITMWGLKDPAVWSSPEAKAHLQIQLAKLISPFKAIDQFSIAVNVDGTSLDLVDFGQKLRGAAATTFTFNFDGDTLKMVGEAKLAYCRPAPSGVVERNLANDRFAAYISSDSGEKLFHRLVRRTSSRPGALALHRSERSGWFVMATASRVVSQLDKYPTPPASPGPFSGALDTFVFAGHTDLRVSPELKEAIKATAGIRVYRDGFGIQLGSDWLGFAKHITKGSSYFELKLENTVGYVAISAEHNAQLEETSDRQRFKEDTPAFRAFQLLMAQVAKFVGEFHELLRRETSAFLTEEASRGGNVDPGSSLAQIDRKFTDHVDTAKAVKTKVERQQTSLQKMRDQVKAQGAPAAQQTLPLPFAAPVPGRGVVELLQGIDEVIEDTQGVLNSVKDVLARADVVGTMRNLLVERYEVLDRQTVLLHETASLGISAEIMAHEIAQIAAGLLERSVPLLRTARQGLVEPADVIRFVEHVRSQSSALQQQANHIAPALRYVRERRSNLNVLVVLDEILKYHGPRLRERRAITLRLKSLGDSQFVVLMNQGKLTQVLDNLILNAEYWVAEQLRKGNEAWGTIDIEIDRPFVYVSDSGTGVDPAVEDFLFEQPFITTKKDGRGLGLFLSRRMLESDGCTLTLAPDRNDRDRRYRFQLDLSGVLNDGN